MPKPLILMASIVLLVGCGSGNPRAASGFRLPDGTPDAGRLAFEQLRCTTCHHAFDPSAQATPTPAGKVSLGGPVTRVKTYGELVTSVINPSHRIAPGTDPAVVAPAGRSVMEDARLNDVMTVRQLIDLVAYLQTLYPVVPPDIDPYVYRYPAL